MKQASGTATGFGARSTLMRIGTYGIALVGLLFMSQPGAAQDGDLGSLRLPVNSEDLHSQSLVAPLPQPQDSSQKPTSEQEQQQKQKQQDPPQKDSSSSRILWIVPNFLTVENADHVSPLSPGQKFKLTAKGQFDPFQFVLVGFIAGFDQAADTNPAYGQEIPGYAKRYATVYGDNMLKNFLGSAAFPSLLHQDPRYFQLGRGVFWRRTGHALVRVLITRSDSGHRQLNYSELGGGLAAAAISTYSYHPQNERGVGNVLSVWGTELGWEAGTLMMKEFWPDLRKHAHRRKHELTTQGQASDDE